MYNLRIVCKIKDLSKEIIKQIEDEDDRQIEEGFRQNSICDNYGYCGGEDCPNFKNCGGA